MLKKAKIRLLTRVAHCGECVFAGVYRAATVRESVPNDFFSSLLRNVRNWPAPHSVLRVFLKGKVFARGSRF
jgi:hypothetical protein